MTPTQTTSPRRSTGLRATSWCGSSSSRRWKKARWSSCATARTGKRYRGRRPRRVATAGLRRRRTQRQRMRRRRPCQRRRTRRWTCPRTGAKHELRLERRTRIVMAASSSRPRVHFRKSPQNLNSPHDMVTRGWFGAPSLGSMVHHNDGPTFPLRYCRTPNKEFPPRKTLFASLTSPLQSCQLLSHSNASQRPT